MAISGSWSARGVRVEITEEAVVLDQFWDIDIENLIDGIKNLVFSIINHNL